MNGWAPGPAWTGGKSRPLRDSIPDRPSRSQSLYRLSYRAHHQEIFLDLKCLSHLFLSFKLLPSRNVQALTKSLSLPGRSLSDSSTAVSEAGNTTKPAAKKRAPVASCGMPASNHLEAFETSSPCVREETFSVLNRSIVRLHIFRKTGIVQEKKNITRKPGISERV